MAGPTERGRGQYDKERALRLHQRITDVLRTKHAAGDIRLITPTPEPLRLFGYTPTLLVAPTTPLLTGESLESFRKGLLQGITPDYELATHDHPNGDFSFGTMFYDNVPGYIRYGDGVTEHPHHFDQADPRALDKLVEETGKPANELVRSTIVQLFPDPTFAETVHSYAIGLDNGLLPYSGLMSRLSSNLRRAEITVLRDDPDRFHSLLNGHLEKIQTVGKFRDPKTLINS